MILYPILSVHTLSSFPTVYNNTFPSKICIEIYNNIEDRTY